jgi:hypothetical protein
MEHGPISTETPTPGTLMSGVPRDADRPASRWPVLGRFMGRRRRYLVDGSYQVRSALVAVLGMAFLAAFSILLFHLLTIENARDLTRRAPILANGASSGDARPVLYLVAVGILFVAAVFVVEILETHKTAGVVYKVTRGLTELQAGRWGAKVTLRKHDNFREMEEAFNAAARALRDRVDADLRSLQAIEGQVRLLGRELESGNREGALVLLRRVAGDLQTLREGRRNLLRAAPDGPSRTESS